MINHLTALLPAARYVLKNRIGLVLCLMFSSLTFGCNKQGDNKTDKQLSLPVVETTSVTNITQTSAVSGGNITSDGGATISSRGVCWSTNLKPTIDDSRTSDSLGTGPFASLIAALQPNTSYHLRAYATNSGGTSYGQDVAFTTRQTGMPSVKTGAITNLTDSSLDIEGTVISDSGSIVTVRGVCWSTVAHPTVNAANKIDSGSGTGTFKCHINGLNGGTIYYFRAYATNVKGTSYGGEIGISTPKGVPTVSTDSVGNLTSSSATISGMVVKDNGSPVLTRGFYWGPEINPRLQKTNNGSGIGHFISNLSGIVAGTYHVRAYASNALGEAMGNDVLFTIYSTPTVVTNNIDFNNVTSTSAVIAGSVTNDGSSPVNTRGICWSTSPNPTIANNKTVEGSGVGTFSSAITGLSPITLYYARAYAINNSGTSYGNQVSFATAQLTLAIGQTYGGGKVFYIDPDNRYALIAAPEDIYQISGIGYKWNNGSNIDVGISSATIGSYNTNRIVAVQGSGYYAAKACKDYNAGGLLDWFLPSKDQLNLMYLQKGILNMTNLGSNSVYWSSTQEQGSYVTAYAQNFSTGLQSGYAKGVELRVRPIRGVCLTYLGCSGLF